MKAMIFTHYHLWLFLKRGLEHSFNVHSLVLKQYESKANTFQRVGKYYLSFFSLGIYQYILEGKELLILELRKQIIFAEALLEDWGDDGKILESYQLKNSNDPYASEVPKELNIVPLDYENEAYSLYSHYRQDEFTTGLSFDDFCGAFNIKMLKKQLAAEKKRVRLWHRGKSDQR